MNFEIPEEPAAMSSWRAKLEEERGEVGDRSPIVAVLPSESALDVEWIDDINGVYMSDVPAITIWTRSRVYIPVHGEGRCSLVSAPRKPTGIGTEPREA